MALTTEQIDTPHCEVCGNEIDPDWCHCGEPMDGGVHDNHHPVPIGCSCFQASAEIVVGFTGTSKGMTLDQQTTVDKLIANATKFHHGDCVGSDMQAHHLVPPTCEITIHPPKIQDKRANCHMIKRGSKIWVRDEYEYLERNHHIVDACDVLIATPHGVTEELRSGTWATIRYARKQHKCVIIVWPDGSIQREDNANQLELAFHEPIQQHKAT